MPTPPGLMADILRHNAEQRPDATAVEYHGQRTGFAAFALRAEAIARGLAGLGCGAGERVAMLSRNSPAMLELYAACELARCIAVPLNFRLAEPEVRHVLAATSPRVLLFEAEWLPWLERLRAACPQACLMLLDDAAEAPAGIDSYPAFVAAAPASGPLPRPRPDDALYIIHTTGTTGRPKGAVLTQAGMHAAAAAIATDGALAPADRGLIVQPLFHVGAKFLYSAHHLAGAGIVLERQFDPARCWALLAGQGITTLQLAPAMLQMLLDAAPEAADAPRLRALFYSTGPIREALLRRGLARFGPVFIQHYGSTEAGVISTLGRDEHRPDGSAIEQQRLLSAGRAAPGVALRLVDAAGREVPSGEPGEIQVRTAGLLAGYWNDPEATAAAFDGQGWFAMGDIGRLDAEGYLYIVDRKRDMIITGGENVYPREVEIALESHPDVAECAVFAVPDLRWSERVHAVVVPRENAAPELDELRGWCRERIAAYKCPRSLELMAALPRLANGKVDKNRLRAPHWPDGPRRVS